VGRGAGDRRGGRGGADSDATGDGYRNDRNVKTGAVLPMDVEEGDPEQNVLLENDSDVYLVTYAGRFLPLQEVFSRYDDS